MLDVATLNVKQQLNRIIASCAFNKYNSNPCSIQLRNSSDHVVLVLSLRSIQHRKSLKNEKPI